MSRPHYEKGFKQTIVELLDNGNSIENVCKEYNLNRSTVYRWKMEYTTETGAFKDEATLAYEHEIRELKKQLKDAQMERDILKKAVRIFSVSDKK